MENFLRKLIHKKNFQQESFENVCIFQLINIHYVTSGVDDRVPKKMGVVGNIQSFGAAKKRAGVCKKFQSCVK